MTIPTTAIPAQSYLNFRDELEGVIFYVEETWLNFLKTNGRRELEALTEIKVEDLRQFPKCRPGSRSMIKASAD